MCEFKEIIAYLPHKLMITVVTRERVGAPPNQQNLSIRYALGKRQSAVILRVNLSVAPDVHYVHFNFFGVSVKTMNFILPVLCL